MKGLITIILFEEVFTEENLYDQYFIALKGKRNHTSIIKYNEHMLANLNNLRNRLLSGNYIPNKDRKFIIYEPKKREIIANCFEDKIVQGLLVRKVLSSLIEPKLIYDNYASRPFMGTDEAYNRIKKFLHSYYINNSNSNNGYILKCDIKKYFYNIDIEIVLKMIDKLNIDNRLKDLLHIEIRPANGIDKGLCIGHELSQWLAIYYLNIIDHFIKESLNIKYYGRYMDDFYLIHSNKDYLILCLNKINCLLNKLKLELNKKTQIFHISEGIKFLGFHIYLTETGKVKFILLKSSIKRMRKRMKSVYHIVNENPELIYSVLEGFNSWKSHAVKGSNRHILYVLDDEFYNLYHDILIKMNVNFALYCYKPGMYEKNENGKKKIINSKYLIQSIEHYMDPILYTF